MTLLRLPSVNVKEEMTKPLADEGDALIVPPPTRLKIKRKDVVGHVTLVLVKVGTINGTTFLRSATMLPV